MSRLTKFSGFWLFVACCFSVLPCTFLSSCAEKHQTGKNVFHYNEQTGIASLDPAFAKNQSIMWAVHQLYNTLVEVDKDLHIVPSLAKRWTISEDKKTYMFFLR